MNSLEWLAAAAIMTALFWMPYVLERMVALGVFGAIKTVEPEDELKQALWARRAKRAHYNAVENLVVFATLVLVAQAMGKAEASQVVLASQVYFWARLVHFPSLTFGLPGIRTVAYLTSFAAQMMVAFEIFS